MRGTKRSKKKQKEEPFMRGKRKYTYQSKTRYKPILDIKRSTLYHQGYTSVLSQKEGK